MNFFHLPAGGLPAFPDPGNADKDGLVAFGGRLSVSWLTHAYRRGIFPWYDESSPILWWSPDPRFVLFPGKLHTPRSLRRQVNNPRWRVSVDAVFERVIRNCAGAPRPGQTGTWILPEIIQAYCALHEAGYAHSVEVWREDGTLAGGLYGVAMGQVFFGESMFHALPDASKIGFVWLTRLLEEWGYQLIDCQQVTQHLSRFGASAITRKDFMLRLEALTSAAPSDDAWRIPSGFHPLRLSGARAQAEALPGF